MQSMWAARYRSVATFILGLVLGFIAGTPTAWAEADTGFRTFVESLWPEAQAIGVSRATFDGAFAGVKPILTLPELGPPSAAPSGNKGQAEFLKTAADYLKESRLQGLAKVGKAKLAAHAKDLQAIETKMGVSPYILLSIWGRETDFGREVPKFGVIDVLATQAYLGRRKDYFRAELLAALQILQDGDIDRASFKGSWAGAMGLTQFMPSGFRRYGIDFDGDGRRNIWTSVPDSLASSAQELLMAKERDGSDVSWQRGKAWGYEVRKPAQMDCTLQGYDKPRPIKDWVKLGYTRAYGKAFPSDQLDDPAYLLLPEGTDGPAFLVTRNFLALKAYNYADLYALFVGHLGDRIAGAPAFETPWAKDAHLTEREIHALQAKLIALGLDVGKHDGKIGWRMRLALGQYESKNGLAVDCYPSADDMAALGAG
jgi:lytic murein transglycosylase